MPVEFSAPRSNLFDVLVLFIHLCSQLGKRRAEIPVKDLLLFVEVRDHQLLDHSEDISHLQHHLLVWMRSQSSADDQFASQSGGDPREAGARFELPFASLCPISRGDVCQNSGTGTRPTWLVTALSTLGTSKQHPVLADLFARCQHWQ
jgi:hypothetical protein